MEVGWLRTHIMVMPISALFLPIDLGPGFPQSWGHFFDVAGASRSGQIELSSEAASTHD
jgi:hypothetical protein